VNEFESGIGAFKMKFKKLLDLARSGREEPYSLSMSNFSVGIRRSVVSGNILHENQPRFFLD
jgi:hypothetical protein